MNRAKRRAALSQAKRDIRHGNWTDFEQRIGVERYPNAPSGLKRAYVNSLFSVQVFELPSEYGVVLKMLVRRHDASSNVRWADLQRVKNELAGPERLAIQVFPPETELVDQANMYWLLVMPLGWNLPVDPTRWE